MLSRCPLLLVDSDYVDLYNLFIHYKNGYLPESGGILDQNNKLMEAFSIFGQVEYEVNKYE